MIELLEFDQFFLTILLKRCDKGFPGTGTLPPERPPQVRSRYAPPPSFAHRCSSDPNADVHCRPGAEHKPADWHAIRSDGRPARAAAAWTTLRCDAVLQLHVRLFFRHRQDFSIHSSHQLFRPLEEDSPRSRLQRKRRKAIRPDGKHVSRQRQHLFRNHTRTLADSHQYLACRARCNRLLCADERASAGHDDSAKLHHRLSFALQHRF